MKKILSITIIVILAILVFGIYVLKRPEAVVYRAAMEKKCVAIGTDVNFGPTYKGKLIDTHIHLPDGQEDWLFGAGKTPTISDYICTFSQEDTAMAFVFVPVYRGGSENRQLAIAKEIQKQHGDKFKLFIMPPDDDGSVTGFPTVEADVLTQMLQKAPGVFVGYGEIGLYERGDHGGPKGAPALLPDAPRLQAIYPVVRKHNLVIYFHLGEGQQAAFERIAADNRDIPFIFHGDQLVVYGEGTQDLSALDDILYRNPNVYYGVDELYGDTWLLRPDVSKEKFLAHFANYEELLEKDVATWKKFIERHPDQVLWGTDRGWFGDWALDPEVGIYLTRYARAFINRLNPSVQEKIAYMNAEKILFYFSEGSTFGKQKISSNKK